MTLLLFFPVWYLVKYAQKDVSDKARLAKDSGLSGDTVLLGFSNKTLTFMTKVGCT